MVTMTNLGFVPKGRPTVRKVRPSGRQPRWIDLWDLRPKAGSTLERLERVYLTALEAIDQHEQRLAEARSSGKFTNPGLVDHSLTFAASTLMPRLYRERQAVEQAKAAVADRRVKLALKPPDKADAAAQILRLWKLDKFNALPDAERNSAVADVALLDPDLAAAILQAPAYSKVHASDLDRLRDHALRAQHRDEALAELHDLERGIAVAEGALVAVRDEIAADVGGEAALAKAAEPYERAATAPFLRKCQRYETDPKFGKPFVRVKEEYVGAWQEGVGWRPATEAEIANGIYYENYAAYQAAQNGDLSRVPSEKQNGAGAAGADAGAT